MNYAEDIYTEDVRLDGERGSAFPIWMPVVAFWVLLFAVASIVGWVYETIDNAVRLGGFHWRASLAGPWCPMYGVGGVAIVALFESWTLVKRKMLLTRIASVLATAAGVYIVCTVVEFAAAIICSVTMGYVPWNYSESWGNAFGVVAPAFTLKFVVGGLLCLYVVAPLLRTCCNRYTRQCMALVGCFICLLATDAALEFAGVWQGVIPRDVVPADAPRVHLDDVFDNLRPSLLATKGGA